MKYDLIVIGSGPAGEKAAVKAAYFLHKVALVEKSSIYGGAATGLAIPTKILKETALYLSHKYEKGLYGIDLHGQWKSSIDQFMYRKNLLMDVQSKAVYDNLVQHHVDIYQGTASFLDSHRIEVTSESGKEVIEGENILIATGSITSPPKEIPVDGKRVHTVETILDIKRIPSSLCIIGAGVIGCEFATIFSTIGVKVYLLNRSSHIFPFCDQEIVQNLLAQMKQDGIEFLFDTNIQSIKVPEDYSQKIQLTLGSEKKQELEVDMVLFAASRKSQVESLCCDKAGVQINEKGLINVDKNYCTNIPHIYAAGDIIGFPSLANVGMDQGRAAVSHMFGMHDMDTYSIDNLPYGIYTVPEISTVGISEEKARLEGLDFNIGKAYYSDSVRGSIMGAKCGLVKLIFNQSSLEILGVHIFGILASELIHYGVELVQSKLTLNNIIGKNCTFPSLHELYKYAAYDGLSTLTGRKMKKHIPND